MQYLNICLLIKCITISL